MRSKLKMMNDLGLMALDLGLMRYPSFVYGRKPKATELPPILCMHTGQPEPFEEWCRYLSRNNINTLSSEQYADRVTGKESTGERDVYLTFDDGHLGVWSVIEPLFRKYGLRGTTFLIPGRMPALGSDEASVIRPSLDNVWAGECDLEAIIRGNEDGYALASWAENKAMHVRDHMDFQAHTLMHRLIVVSDKIIGFVTPELARSAHPFELAMLATRKGEQASADVSMPPVGTPIYESESRMSATRACFPNPEVALQCVAHVATSGGEAFFNHPNWEAQLRKIAQFPGRPTEKATFETAAEQYSAIEQDLQRCKELIEAALPSQTVNHLAYPWGVGSHISTDIARKAGYEYAYWGRVQSRLINQIDVEPLMLARIGEDFFNLLPGADRSTLAKILLSKLTRRYSSGSPYLSH